MKIEVNKKETPQVTAFSDVLVGEVFVHRAIPYLRMPQNSAVNLTNGQSAFFARNTRFLVVKNVVLSYDEP